jgi:hypothetical protein
MTITCSKWLAAVVVGNPQGLPIQRTTHFSKWLAAVVVGRSRRVTPTL